MRDRPFVEAVDLQLDPVEVELDEEVALEQPRDLVADPASAVARVDDEASRFGDPVRLVRTVEADAPGTLADWSFKSLGGAIAFPTVWGLGGRRAIAPCSL